MSRTTRLVLGGAALLLAVCGVWFGMTPKNVHMGACGSPFFPATGAVDECAFALDKRYTVLWWVFTAVGVLGLAAALGGMFATTKPPEDSGSGRTERH
jgi:hypothetical protein